MVTMTMSVTSAQLNEARVTATNIQSCTCTLPVINIKLIINIYIIC